jgi:hypothetical protein
MATSDIDLEDIELPIRYIECNLMMAAFSASAERLQRLTPDDLRVVELFPGRAAFGVACYEYLRTSIGPYNEIGLVWPGVEAKRRPPPLLPLLFERRWPKMGYWVHRLPVTTDLANRAGRAFYGYPKFVADIDFEWEDATRICTLAEGGSQILQLSLDTRLPARPAEFPLYTYSVRGDELLRTRIDVDAVGIRRTGRGNADLQLGPHRVGRELAELDLRLNRPIEMRWFPVYRAILPEAQERHPLAAAYHFDPEVREVA